MYVNVTLGSVDEIPTARHETTGGSLEFARGLSDPSAMVPAFERNSAEARNPKPLGCIHVQYRGFFWWWWWGHRARCIFGNRQASALSRRPCEANTQSVAERSTRG